MARRPRTFVEDPVSTRARNRFLLLAASEQVSRKIEREFANEPTRWEICQQPARDAYRQVHVFSSEPVVILGRGEFGVEEFTIFRLLLLKHAL